MKKTVLLLLVFIFLFSGCENGYDINERVIVQGVGIDYAYNGFEVTVQTLNTSTYSGIGGAKVPENLIKNYCLKGKTVADALSKLTAAAGKRPLFTHTRIVLIGNEQAKRGLKNVIDFFTRDSNCHSALFVAVCSKTAKETLMANEGKESVPAVEIEDIVKNSEELPNAVGVHIYELIKMYRERTTSAYLPVVSVTKDSGGKQSVRIDNTAVFKDDKLSGYIDLNDTVNLSVFTNKVKNGNYTLDGFRYGEASFDFYSSRCKTDVGVDTDGRISFNIHLNCVFDCVEFVSFYNDELDEKMLKEMENAIEKQLSDKMESFLYRMCRQGTDCMRFGRILLFKEQNLYKRNENDWDKALSSIKITVTAKATVRRIGQESGKSAI